MDNTPFFTEADLSGHLENDDEDGTALPPAARDELVARDFQLRSGLNLLKGMAIMANKKVVTE